jgi:hypothetical protein
MLCGIPHAIKGVGVNEKRKSRKKWEVRCTEGVCRLLHNIHFIELVKSSTKINKVQCSLQCEVEDGNSKFLHNNGNCT